MKRAAQAIRRALGESEHCPVLLENTAGTQGPLGRDFGELAELLELLGGEARIGICLDSCHLLASGYDIRDAERLAAVVDEFDATVGLDRLRCLHVNDSQIPLGGNRDRHTTLGDGELGREGIAAFLAEPRFEKLPALLETGPEGEGAPDLTQVELAKRLRERGLKMRSR
jgi:deoxyribonuclease-4